MKFSKITLLLISGFTIGAIVGLLIAPEAGEETIEKIKSKGRKFKDMAEQAAQDVSDAAGDLYDSVKNKADEVVGAVTGKQTDQNQNKQTGPAGQNA